MPLRFVAAILLLGAILPIQTVAESTDCGSPVIIIPDGRLTPGSFPQGTTYWYGLYGQVGHSYAVEFEPADNFFSSNRPEFSAITVYSPVDSLAGCRGTSSATVTANGGYSPVIMKGGNGGGRRVSVIAQATGLYLISATNVMAAGAYTFRAVDTTLFTPRWSTSSGQDVQWGFFNISEMPVVGILFLFDSTGQLIYTTGVSIPAGGRLSRTTGSSDMNLGRNGLGAASFAHNAPPSAILGDAMLIYSSGGTPLPLKFETIHPQ